MMDLSDYEWKMRQEWGEAEGKPAPPRNRGWSNLQKGRLREHVRDFEAALERDRAGLASRERARYHHELRMEKDDEWRATHDEECRDCSKHRATSFGLDTRAMHQVRDPPPGARSRPSLVHSAPRPQGDGKEARPAGTTRPPPPPCGERQGRRSPESHGEPRRGSGVSPPAGMSASDVLHLFAGPPRRRRSVARYGGDLGASVCEVDILGGADLCDEAVFGWLLREAKAGTFKAAVAGIPCQSFSVLRVRVRTAKGKRRRAPEGSRTRQHPEDSG